ncbi:hypothetical protein JNUCC0626_12915 [Lentzea sp. JNUCC 0626]|uniref:hypothetical protein n=1 Tax=Lentzea sp. JNUCC 0626 TaxID=3367513 RepID=UPI003747E366
MFLVCHGLDLSGGIARWWWRAFAGVLGIRVGQSLALIAALRVFFAEGGFTIFGPTPTPPVFHGPATRFGTVPMP